MQNILFKGSKSGADIHKEILNATKKITTYYTDIMSIVSKMIISPNK